MMYQDIRYPISYQTRLLDRIAFKIGIIPVIFCSVCGNISSTIMIKENIRESSLRVRCRSINRQRQLAYVLCRSFSNVKRKRILHCLENIVADQSLSIYNSEAHGAIHNSLSKMKNYICSEYYGPQYKSGEIVNGMLHEDIMSLSFADKTFDIVLSADVLEHIPRPYDAHREIWRA